jgi:hypothetical protein
MSNSTEAGNHCIIVVADLFAKINAQRKLLKRPPVEDRAIASRCTLRFNADKQRGVDFTTEKILVASHEIPLLEKIVNELFGVYFEGEVQKLCAKPKTPPAKRTQSMPPPQMAMAAPAQTKNSGLVSKLKRMFGGK